MGLSRAPQLPVGTPDEVELIGMRWDTRRHSRRSDRDRVTSLTRRRRCPTSFLGLKVLSHSRRRSPSPTGKGASLRYRGVDIEDLVGHVSYGNVWGLLVDNEFNPGLPPAEPFPLPVHSGDVRVDVQSALAMLAPAWGLGRCSTSTTNRRATTSRAHR